MIDARLLRLAVMASNDGIVITDARAPDNPILWVNPAFERMTGYSAEQVVGHNCRFLQGPDREQPELERLREALRRREGIVVKLRNYRKDGSMFWNELSISPVADEAGEVSHYIGVQKDITARVEAEDQLALKTAALEEANRKLHELAIRDGLTGLFNRRHLNERLEQLWRMAGREEGEIVALMVDIDYFKQYNDAYGHKAGDECLRRVAAAIGGAFQRAGDVVARYGGEEFVVLTSGKPGEQPRSAAERLRLAVRRQAVPHRESSVSDVVTVSVGVAVNRHDLTQGPMDLVKHADEALYEAKRAGRDRAVCWQEPPRPPQASRYDERPKRPPG